MTIGWGIAGPGRMAEAFASDLKSVPDCALVAVGSRSRDRAYQFAAHYDGPHPMHAHGSYEALVNDPGVDVIYIATPHPQHKAIALQAIAAGKAVLVEKAFCATYDSAREVVDAARDKGVFAMEAMWTRFQPVVNALREMVGSGQLGELVGVQGDLFAYREFNASDRLFAPELGGGAILDLGVYVVSFAQQFLGDPSDVAVRGHKYPNGVEASASFLLSYPSGATASLACGLNAEGPGRMMLAGTKGWVDVLPRFHHAQQMSVHRAGTLTKHYDLAPMGKGYSHEIIEVNRCLSEGLTESPVMPLSDTLSVMRTLQDGLDWFGNDHSGHES